jgi:hypothetical protein
MVIVGVGLCVYIYGVEAKFLSSMTIQYFGGLHVFPRSATVKDTLVNRTRAAVEPDEFCDHVYKLKASQINDQHCHIF